MRTCHTTPIPGYRKGPPAKPCNQCSSWEDQRNSIGPNTGFGSEAWGPDNPEQNTFQNATDRTSPSNKLIGSGLVALGNVPVKRYTRSPVTGSGYTRIPGTHNLRRAAL